MTYRKFLNLVVPTGWVKTNNCSLKDIKDQGYFTPLYILSDFNIMFALCLSFLLDRTLA